MLEVQFMQLIRHVGEYLGLTEDLNILTATLYCDKIIAHPVTIYVGYI